MGELLNSCPLCNSTNVARAIRWAPGTKTASFSDVFDKYLYYYRCECGVFFQSPFPSQNSVTEFYSSGEYRATTGFSQEWMDDREQGRANDLVRFLRDQKLHGFTHLDVGCSRGMFLLETQSKLGARLVLGIEPLIGYTDSCIPTVPDIEMVEGKFGLVSAIHVLEHCAAPLALLYSCIDRIESDGYLLIEVPGRGGPFGKAHLFYFPMEIVLRWIVELGLTIIGLETVPHTRILARLDGKA